MYLLVSCLRVGTDNGFVSYRYLSYLRVGMDKRLLYLSQVRISTDNRLPVSGEGWH